MHHHHRKKCFEAVVNTSILEYVNILQRENGTEAKTEKIQK